MSTFEIVQLIEVTYTIEAEDEDEAFDKADTMSWDVTPYGAKTGDLDAFDGGSILSFSEYDE